MGGIASFNKNIIENTSLRNDATLKVILVDQLDSDHPRFKDSFAADEVIPFEYGTYENRYTVLKRFSRLLSESPGAVLCNDGLEMQAIHQYGTAKTVYHMIHDFYNLKLVIKVPGITDAFFTHSKLFHDVLVSEDPVSNQAFYIPHGVKISKDRARDESQILRIAFVGRWVSGKGVLDLFEINNLLIAMGVQVEWTIIGGGELEQELTAQWQGRNDVRFASPATNAEVIGLMHENDIFMLPTRFEGFPVTILEALSCGLVTIVSDLPGGIRDCVTEEIGFRIPVGDNAGFANAVAQLDKNREKLNQMAVSSRKLAVHSYDIKVTSNRYMEKLLEFEKYKRPAIPDGHIQFGFRLDKKWIPNSVVSFLRKNRNARA